MKDYKYEEFNHTKAIDEDDYGSFSIFKVVYLGDSGVGKTNLMTRFATNTFNINSKPTIGVDFSMKNIILGEHLIRIQIWDTAGQERYQTFTNAYFKESQGVILVYDIASKESFESIQRWLELAYQHVDVKKCSILLIGNKTDLANDRQVGVAEGEDFAKKNGLLFFEASARTNENDCVGRSFLMILNGALIRNPPKKPDSAEWEAK